MSALLVIVAAFRCEETSVVTRRCRVRAGLGAGITTIVAGCTNVTGERRPYEEGFVVFSWGAMGENAPSAPARRLTHVGRLAFC